MEICRIVDIGSTSHGNADPAQWTAVVPAAGKGSRLGYHCPKLLYPLLDRPILHWLIDALHPVADTFLFVLSPDGRPEVEPYLKRILGDAYGVAVQEEPTGMGDAVLLAEERVKTPYTLVIWGDQVMLNPLTVKACAAVHQSRPGATLTLPTVVKRDPYIHLERNAEQKITGVRQARENEIETEYGESDCGLFLFSTARLFPTLAAARGDGGSMGASTGEFNLLQTLPRFEIGPGSVVTVRINDPVESMGVNTLEEARSAEIELKKRQAESDRFSTVRNGQAQA